MNMMNEQLRNQIETSWSDSTMPAQQRELLNLIVQNEPGLKEDLDKEFENDIILNLQYLPDKDMQEVFDRICQQLGLESMAVTKPGKMKRLRLYKWVSAVAAVLVIAAGFYWYSSWQVSPAALAGSGIDNPPETWQNNTAEEQVRRLDDGSTVILSPNSKLTYPRHFDNTKRLITLLGKASFEVAKDSMRPFTVYAGSLATTALGTRFMIDMSVASTQVNLFEGKVVVLDTTANERHEAYLLPGEQLRFDNVHKRLIIDGGQKPAEVVRNGTAVQSGPEVKYNDMEFAQTPIVEVFDALAKRYKVRFEYDREQVSAELVTGKFMADEQLNTVLKILETINGFSFRRKGNTIIVTK